MPNPPFLDLHPTTDIIKSIAKNTQATIVALRLKHLMEKEWLKKLKDKGADVIKVNHPSEDGCGIESNFNKVIFYQEIIIPMK